MSLRISKAGMAWAVFGMVGLGLPACEGPKVEEIIEYRKSSCHGCPIFDLVVRPNGEIEFDGQAHVLRMGKHRLTATPEQLAKFRNAVEPYKSKAEPLTKEST